MTAPLRPEDALAVIERVAKARPGYRRGHARGLVLLGSFQAEPEARGLTTAAHMQGLAVPCLVRVSNASANPCTADRESPTGGRVLGLAVRFELPGLPQKAATWAAINIPSFPARTPEDFIALTAAQAPGPGGKPNMLRLLWHVLRHAYILASVKGIKSLKPSGSFAMETFHGIHTYYLVDAAGERKPFRYHWMPRLANQPLTPAEATLRPDLYLLKEIRARLEQGPVAWDLFAQFPEAGDDLINPSVAWPKERPRVKLGTLTVDKAHEDQASVEGLVFDPTGVVPGIEISQDPILNFRPLVYGLSYERRTREKRAEPAPEDMGQ